MTSFTLDSPQSTRLNRNIGRLLDQHISAHLPISEVEAENFDIETLNSEVEVEAEAENFDIKTKWWLRILTSSKASKMSILG